MKNKLVIIYDYDGTLAPGSIQEPALIPLITGSNDVLAFWRQANNTAKLNGLDSNLCYMIMILEHAKKQGIVLTKDFFRECGSKSVNFPGVSTWFKRLDEYALSLDVTLEHYIISSGNYELLIGTKIAKYFKKIYACQFFFDNEKAVYPAFSIDDYYKTKFVKEITESINISSDDSIRHRIIYIGDGFTDIPAMNENRLKGGLSFLLYSSKKEETSKRASFLDKGIVDNLFSTETCYKKGSVLESIVKNEIKALATTQLTIFDLE